MYKQEKENQGDQANRRGRARRSRTKCISDLSGMFTDLTMTDVVHKKKMSSTAAFPSLVEREEED